MYISHTTINILCFIFIGMIGYLIYLKRQIQWYNTESRYDEYIWEATICFLHILIYGECKIVCVKGLYKSTLVLAY